MAGLAYSLGVFAAAIGIAFVAWSVTSAMARQPEVQGRLFTVFILGAAFIEALALIGFIVALMSIIM